MDVEAVEHSLDAEEDVEVSRTGDLDLSRLALLLSGMPVPPLWTAQHRLAVEVAEEWPCAAELHVGDVWLLALSTLLAHPLRSLPHPQTPTAPPTLHLPPWLPLPLLLPLSRLLPPPPPRPSRLA